MKPIARILACLSVFLICMQTVSAAQPPTPRTIENYETEKVTDQLLLLIQKRLAVMHEVARTKWNQKLAIEDKAREQIILTNLVEQCKKYGLDEKWVATFFQAQMDASKTIQRNDFELWRRQGIVKFDGVLDLKDQIRIYIDQINQEMMVLLAKLEEKDTKAINNRYVLDQPISIRESDHIDDSVWTLAISPFGK